MRRCRRRSEKPKARSQPRTLSSQVTMKIDVSVVVAESISAGNESFLFSRHFSIPIVVVAPDVSPIVEPLAAISHLKVGGSVCVTACIWYLLNL